MNDNCGEVDHDYDDIYDNIIIQLYLLKLNLVYLYFIKCMYMHVKYGSYR
jgi:hypothetical protein